MAMSYELVLTRMLDGEERQRLRHGDVYVSGEQVQVSLHATAAGASTEKGERKLRVQWVAEVGTGGGLSSNSNSSSSSSSSNNGKFYSSKEEPTTIRACPKQGVMRAVPEGGDDFVVWELPSEEREGGRGGGQEATIRVAFAARYGTIYFMEGLTLRRRKVGKRNRFVNGGGGGGGGGGGREDEL